MDTKPKYITNYFNLLVNKIDFDSKFPDINRLVATYVLNKKFFKFINIFPVSAVESNELIRPNTIVEACTKSHAVKHLEWVLQTYYPGCMWLKHKKYKDIKALLLDKIHKPETPREVNKLRTQRIYNLSKNEPLDAGYPEKKSSEIVHFLNKLPKIWVDKYYHELPVDNPLYLFDKSGYYLKLMDWMITNWVSIPGDYEIDLTYFTRDVILGAYYRSSRALGIIPEDAYTQELVNEIIQMHYTGIAYIPSKFINADNLIEFINLYPIQRRQRYRNDYDNRAVLADVIKKISPQIVMNVMGKDEKYLNTVLSVMHQFVKSETNSQLLKNVLNKYPEKIAKIFPYGSMFLGYDKYRVLFEQFAKDKCMIFIKYSPEVIRAIPPGFFNSDDLIHIITEMMKSGLSLRALPSDILTRELGEKLHTNHIDIFNAVIEAHPALLTLFTESELKKKYSYILNKVDSYFLSKIPAKFFNKTIIDLLIKGNKNIMDNFPSYNITKELCELLHANHLNIFNKLVSNNPNLIKLFTHDELKNKYFHIFNNFKDLHYYVSKDFYDECTVKKLIKLNPDNIKLIPSEKVPSELCKELFETRTLNTTNATLSAYSKMFAAKLKTSSN